MADITIPGLFLTGNHAGRPSSDIGVGALYACSTHGLIYQWDGASWSTWATLGGSGAIGSDSFWDAAGDLAVGSGSDTAARLAIGATDGMVLQRVSGAVAWKLPPGYEFAYAQITSNVTLNGTTEGGANTIVATSSFTADGEGVIVEFYAPRVSGGGNNIIDLYVDSTIQGRIGVTGASDFPMMLRRKLTPSAGSRTVTVKGWRVTSDGTVYAGAGGSGNVMPAYVRVTKV